MYCPHCGHNLPHPIVHGISSCNNCNRVFDSSPFNLFLSTSWLVRKQHIDDKDTLVQQYGYDPWISEVVVDLVADGGCSHEEVVKVLKELDVCDSFICDEITVDLAS